MKALIFSPVLGVDSDQRKQFNLSNFVATSGNLVATQDEIACFRISETWRKHAAPWFRYIYVLRKRENSNLRGSVTSPERKCQVTFPSYLSQHISAVVRFRRVSANGSPLVCYIYKNTNARLFFEQQ